TSRRQKGRMRENVVAFLPGELSRDRITGCEAGVGFFVGRIGRHPFGVEKRLRKGLRNAGLRPLRDFATFWRASRQKHAPFINHTIEQLGLRIVGPSIPTMAAVNGRTYEGLLPNLWP